MIPSAPDAAIWIRPRGKRQSRAATDQCVDQCRRMDFSSTEALLIAPAGRRLNRRLRFARDRLGRIVRIERLRKGRAEAQVPGQ